jgi:DNA-binding response OmpR family regulator
MLTARTDLGVRLKALRTVVDDYLTKPFSAEELRVRIQKLRERHWERVAARQSPDDVPQEETPAGLSDADAAWLEEVEALFRKNIANPHFSVEEAARAMHLSDRQLTRRRKLLVGLTPNR